MQRVLIVTGVALLALGLAWPWMSRQSWWRWIGRLPGDLHYERDGFSVYLPLMTGLVLSILISVLIWLLRK
jgi:hypothetical protein